MKLDILPYGTDEVKYAGSLTLANGRISSAILRNELYSRTSHFLKKLCSARRVASLERHSSVPPYDNKQLIFIELNFFLFMCEGFNGIAELQNGCGMMVSGKIYFIRSY